MDVFDLAARITLNSSEYDQGLDNAKSKAEGFGSKLKSTLGNTAKVGAAAIGAASAAMVAFGASSVNTGMEFDKSMSQVAATMGTTVDNIQNLRDFAMEMGATTAFSAQESADALNFMALAGYDAETSMSMLPTVLDLAAAGNIDLARASDMVTDAQSALGLSLDETSAMVDQMAQTASKSNTSVEQLGDAILTVGGTAQYMAGGTENINKVLGVLADNGIKGSEAGTHLRNMLLSLSSPTDDAAALIEDLGLQIFDSEGKMRDFADIFPEMNAAMADLTDQQKLDAFSTLFNSRDIASATALLNTSSERWEGLGGYIEDASGAAKQMADTQLDNLAGDITLFKSALEGAQIVVSDQLSPTLRDFVQFGSNAISTLSTAFQEGGLTGAMDALGTILSDGLAMIVEKLPSFIEAGMQLLSSLGQGLIDNLPLITDAAIEIIMMLATGLIDNLPQIIEAGLQVIVQLALGIAEALPELIPTIVSVVLQIVETLIDNIDMLVDAAIAITEALAEGLIDALPILIEKAPVIIAKLVSAIVENVPKLLKAAVEIIKKLATGIVENLPKIGEAAGKIIETVLNGIKNLWNSLVQVGGDIVRGIWEGISGMFSWLWDNVTGFFGGIVDGIKGFLGIHSPSRVFAGIGEFMAQGLGVGFEDEMEDVEKRIQKATNLAIPETGVSINSTINGAGVGVGGNSYTFTPGSIVVHIDGSRNPETLYQEIKRLLTRDVRMQALANGW